MINPSDEWDLLLDESSDEYDDDWFCQSCEHGPIGTEKNKCPRCGTKWGEQYPPEENYDDDGWGEEKEVVEEIW